MPRRLAVARHADGMQPIGWVLIGVLIGAAISIVALSHADWIKRLPDPLKPAATVAIAAPVRAPPPATTVQAATTTAQTTEVMPPVTPTGAQTSTMAAKPEPGEEAQVAEDAAAAGMTSHSAAAGANLN